MKCPNCGGTGKEYWNGNVFCNTGFECDKCNGTGEVEQTTEEWLRSATFEELAGTIYEWHSLGYSKGKRGKKLNPITEVVEWLKQPHTIKE